MSGVHKRFGNVQALTSVNLEVAQNEVHGLLGGNGAGKTTLMNILYGLYRADEGGIEIDGTKVDIGSPRDAISAGIGMVHQSFLQIETYTVTENIVLGSDGLGGLKLDLRPARERIVELSERFGLAVDTESIVEDLPVGIRQRVEILKALYRGSKILILDEPTTNLTPQEVDELFASIRAMVDDGMSVILITHKIRETMSICDRMTVMRNGEQIATIEKSATNPEALASIMVGDEVHAQAEAAVTVGKAAIKTSGGFAATNLVIANDHGVESFSGFDLQIKPGEVLGIAGVAGNGQVELAEAVAGVRPLRSGSVKLDQQELAGQRTADWLAAGVAYVPEDRLRDGILPTRSITDNLLLGSQRNEVARRFGLINWKRARAHAVAAIEKFSIRASGPHALAGDLSGGNIQRVILARAFARQPGFLILHNPTRGLDIGSTQFVYEQVRVATSIGCAVLLISEDLDEVIALSDRVMALYAGQSTGEWLRGETDYYDIGRSMTGLVKSHD